MKMIPDCSALRTASCVTSSISISFCASYAEDIAGVTEEEGGVPFSDAFNGTAHGIERNGGVDGPFCGMLDEISDI